MKREIDAEAAEAAEAAEKASDSAALRVSEALRRFVDRVGGWGAWLFIPVILITVFDVVVRKLVWQDAAGQMQGVQIYLVNNISPIFGSTLLQELEWHFHTALFALVLGYGYIYNAHVRVDLIRENLAFRKQAWLEFLGLTFFLLPYCATIIWFAADYTYASYAIGEISASTVGLTHRWIIKSVLVFGLLVAAIAGIAVWLQVAVVLFAKREERFPLMTLDWPEEKGSKIEGKERVRLEDAIDTLAAPTAKERGKTSSILTGG
ncbi:MAG: TRAP transporter small permease subunit [Gammaproteobacteria bacterium]|nr:TRAP transporter small permease subunit [Gammaproteobacteria bacterium]